MKRLVVFRIVVASLLVAGAAQFSFAADPTTAPATAPSQPTAEIAKLLDLPTDEAYSAVFAIWAGGRQTVAEKELAALTEKHPDDQKLAFFRAACNRSRFDVNGSIQLFEKVVSLGTNSVYSQCALDMIYLDKHVAPESTFKKLENLAEQNSTDPLIVWVTAIQCRSLNKYGEGADYFQRLLKLIAPAPGPSLLHQTYANLLDELKEYDKSLVHRELAVKLEPASWSYQGLGITLAALRRDTEAAAAYAKAIERDPNNSTYWMQWAHPLYDLSKYDQAIVALRRAIELNPNNWSAYNEWALCLERMDKPDEALDKYAKVRELAPTQSYGYTNAALLLHKLGRNAEADHLMLEWALKKPPATNPAQTS